MNERTTLLHGVKLKHNAGAGSPIHPKIINILYQQVIRLVLIGKLLSPGRKFVTCSFIYSNNIKIYVQWRKFYISKTSQFANRKDEEATRRTISAVFANRKDEEASIG